MRSAKPIIAMLWENWRLTRVEAGQRLALGLVLGAGALILSDSGAIIAFVILMLVHSYIWFSIAKLNGGRLADGYKPGFPFYFHFARPVPTAVLVGVAMAYDVISCVALYVLSAALLGFIFGQPFPIFSVVLFLVSYHLAYAWAQWSTRSRVVQWVAAFAFSVPMFFMLKNRVGTPLQVEFSFVENMVMVLISVASIALTVVGVARQRRGDSMAVVVPQKDWSGGYPDWLVALFQFRCPTSSSTRAQVWFELRSSGLPVLVAGFGVALTLFLLCVISTSFGNFRFVSIPIAIIAVLMVLFVLGGNAFGIRRKQGRTYASAFESTLPCGTAKLAGLKVLVRTACVLAALIALGASLWASISLVGDWGQFVMNNNQDAIPLLQKVRQKFADDFGGLTEYAHVALTIVAFIAVASVVSWQAAREALRARYPRLLLVVQWLPTVWGLASITLALAHRNGVVPMFLVRGFFTATFWMSWAAMAIAAIYLLWSGLEQRVVTLVYAGGALAVSVAFGAAWLAGMPATSIVGILWPVWLILMLGLLAPWSLGRARHT
ncbi:MAG TPA: hypothetical protein VFS58_05650 [Steroidobacteraceae bacterium]|nr:hypothetical protein [Steroidobacteraceae bacterium]